jgi:hypothetical protein
MKNQISHLHPHTISEIQKRISQGKNSDLSTLRKGAQDLEKAITKAIKGNANSQEMGIITRVISSIK